MFLESLSTMRPVPWKTVLASVAGVVLVVGLLLHVGVGSVIAALQGADPFLVILSALSYASFFVLRGIRWKSLLRKTAPGVSSATTSSLSAVGWLVSTFVPMKAGDIARATILARRERTSLAGVVGSVAVERGLDVLGLASMASCGLLLAATWGGQHLEATVAEAVAIAWVVPLAALFALYAFAGYFERRRERNVIFRIAGRFLDAVEELRRSPRRILPLILLTLLVSAAQVGVFVALFLAFDSTAPLPLLLGGAPVFLLSFVVSVAPGNVGTYEAAFVLVFGLFGFDPDALIPMSIAVHLLTMSTVTVLGSAGFVVERLARPMRAPEAVVSGVPR